jgi:maleylpyruvate isomerase
MPTTDLVLTSFWRSSCSWRVRIALALKAVPHAITTIHLQRAGGEQFQDDYRAKNRMAQVPLLTMNAGVLAGPVYLSQSMAMLEFIEEEYPDPPLLPKKSLERAKVRQIAEIINSGIQPLQNSSTLKKIKSFDQDEQAWARFWIQDGLDNLEQQLQGLRSTEFLVTDYPSIAECCLIPQLYGARRFGCDVSVWSRLLEVEERCLSFDAFQSSRPENQRDAEL